MNEISKIKRLNAEMDGYLDRLQESHKEVSQLKALIKRYITTIADVEGYIFLDCMENADEKKLIEIYKDKTI